MVQLHSHYLEEQINAKIMIIYTYRLDHDLGLAPNPFGKFCTLTVCKPKIRNSKKLKLGDWVIGTGSKALEETTSRKLTDKLI
jgi:hypothetical protein